MVYDELNRVRHVDELTGPSLTFTYDAVGRRTLVQDSLGGVETSVYDPVGNLRRRQVAADTWVDFFYDANNRPIATGRHVGTISER